MMHAITLTERKAKASLDRQAAADRISALLERYAKAHGGRYLMFGSAARHEMKHDSDLDLIVDFPVDTMTEAVDYAEDLCDREGLPADIIPIRFCSPAFLNRVSTGAKVLA